MITTPEEAEVEIRGRGFPQVFIEILRNNIPAELSGACGPVRRYYVLRPWEHHQLPTCKHYLPLWEVNGECVVAYDVRRDAFVRLYYEDGYDAIVARGYQQFITWLLFDLLRIRFAKNDLRQVATMFEYNYIDKLWKYLEFCKTPQWDKTDTAFLQSIRD